MALRDKRCLRFLLGLTAFRKLRAVVSSWGPIAPRGGAEGRLVGEQTGVLVTPQPSSSETQRGTSTVLIEMSRKEELD